MTERLEKILVPLDGSPLGDKILSHLAALGPLSGAEVRLVRALRDRDIDPDHPEGYRAAQKTLQEVEARLLKAGAAKTESTIVFGDPAENILSIAESWRPDLIAMSTHGRSGIERIVRGSVAERVLRGAEPPVLLVNPFTAPGETKTVLVPLDGSGVAASILPLASKAAHAHGARVVLFHAVERGESGAEALITRSEAKTLLTRYERFFEGLAAEIVLAGKQPPAVEILEAIEKTDADLVVLSTHGRSGVARWVLGSVAEKVLRECRCPVLVKRAITKTPDGALRMKSRRKTIKKA